MNLIWEDVTYQKDAGFVRIIPLADLRRQGFPSNTKVSRLVVVPQVNRRGRLILNLSAPIYTAIHQSRRADKTSKILQPSVNRTSVPAANRNGVDDLGRVLPGLLQYMYDTPPEWTILWSKLDFSDGFWRMVVEGGHEANFLYLLPPRHPTDVTHAVMSGALQMDRTVLLPSHHHHMSPHRTAYGCLHTHRRNICATPLRKICRSATRVQTERDATRLRLYLCAQGLCRRLHSRHIRATGSPQFPIRTMGRSRLPARYPRSFPTARHHRTHQRTR